MQRRPMADPQDAMQMAGLVHVCDDMPGLTRRRSGKGFSCRDPQGCAVRDRAMLDRIGALAIPPAYSDVWICPDPRGHLQATGRDARGRKQYRYHPRFREIRDSAKFDRMLDFAACLAKIRRRVDADMSLRGLPPEKVLATVVHLLESTMIRVGNFCGHGWRAGGPGPATESDFCPRLHTCICINGRAMLGQDQPRPASSQKSRRSSPWPA